MCYDSRVKIGRKGDDKLKNKRTTVVENVCQSMKVLWQEYPATRWQIPLSIIVSVGKPFLVMAIPSLAIAAITEGSICGYIAKMFGALFLVGLLEILDQILQGRLSFSEVLVRMRIFMPQLVCKGLTIRYDKVETQQGQKKMQEAAYSLAGDNCGAEQLMHKTPELIVKTAGLFVYGTAVFVLDVRIICVMLVMCILDIVLRNHAIQYGDATWNERSEVNRQMRYIRNAAVEQSTGKDIRLYHLSPWFCEMFDALIRREKKVNQKNQLRWYFPTIGDQCCIVLRDIIAYSILISQVAAGAVSPAVFTLYLGIIAEFSDWFYGVSENVFAIQKASREHDHYREVMDYKEPKQGETVLSESREEPLEIVFEHVSFRYEGAESDSIRDLDLTIRAGEKVAVVGNNGAGKTTLVKLLCGLYEPAHGRILVNGRDIRELDPEEYKKRVCTIFQDVRLFPFTITSNVCTSEEEKYNPARLWNCLQKAGLREKIEQLPQKEKTYISQVFDENGVLLSGGEMQKLLLARAMYKPGGLLLLDEPTSALDPIAESRMYEQYNEISEGKTAVFISHRLASTKFCERIFFLEKGGIAEQGSHDELMEKNGKYRELFEIQSRYYRKQEGGREEC